jgi:octaprenyl-diphosphate synthase
VSITAPPGATLQTIQLPVRDKLDRVSQTMGEIVASELPLVGQVSAHLLAMRGKMFRPTLLLLSSEVVGEPHDQAIGWPRRWS